MRFRLLPILISVLFSASALAADRGNVNSPYQACASRALYQVQDPSTQIGCARDPDQVSPVGFFQASIGDFTAFQQWHNLSLKAADVQLEEFAINDSLIQLATSCLQGNKSWNTPPKSTDCAQVDQLIQSSILPAAKRARIEQALAFDPGIRDLADRVNTSLRSPTEWPIRVQKARLDNDERKAAIAEFTPVFQDAISSSPSGLSSYPAQPINTDKINHFRKEHQNTLLKLLDDYPMIGFISEENPTPQQFVEALKLLSESNHKAQDHVMDLREQVADYDPNELNAMNELTQRPELMEAMLTADPTLCGAATGLYWHKKFSDDRMAVAQAGALVAGAFAPPAVLIAVSAGGLITASVSIRDRKEEQTQILNSATSAMMKGRNVTSSMTDAYGAGVNYVSSWQSLAIAAAPYAVRKVAAMLASKPRLMPKFRPAN